MTPNSVESRGKAIQGPTVLLEKEKPHLGTKDEGEDRSQIDGDSFAGKQSGVGLHLSMGWVRLEMTYITSARIPLSRT